MRVQKPVSQGDVFAEDAAEVLAAVDVVGCHADPKGLGTGVLRCLLDHALKDAGRCCRCITGRNRNCESSSRVLLKRVSFRQNPGQNNTNSNSLLCTGSLHVLFLLKLKQSS